MSTSNTTARGARPKEAPDIELPDCDEDLRREFSRAVHLCGSAALLAKEVREFETEVARPSYSRSRSRMAGTLERIEKMVRMIRDEL